MPRRIPDDRIEALLEAATRVFIRQGYRRAQMADVALELGVAKGTVYLYVESKAALFEAALKHAVGLLPAPGSLSIPIASSAPGELAKLVGQELAQRIAPPALLRALDRRRVTDAAGELEEIVRGLFVSASESRTAMKLVDRCGPEHPELGLVFYEEGRFALLELLVQYLDARIRRGHLRAVPDIRAAARFVIETVAVWAVHIHWDPAPQPIPSEAFEETVVHFLCGGLLPA